MKLFRRRATILATLLAVAGATPGVAQAQSPSMPGAQPAPAVIPPTPRAQAEARDRFARGLALADDGDFDAAILELQRAYDLAPSYKILYDIGVISQQLKRYARAYEAYEQYLRDGGAEVPADRVEDVRRRVERLKERVAYLTVTSDPAGADVLVDDVLVGRTPLVTPLRVNSGQRKVSVKVSGHPMETRVVELTGGERKAVPFDLNSVTPAAVPARSVVPIVSWAVTGGLTAAAVTTGILAISSTKSYDDDIAAPNPSKSTVNSAWDKAHGFALATDVVGAIAIAAAAVSIYFTIKPPKPSRTSAFVALPGVVYGEF